MGALCTNYKHPLSFSLDKTYQQLCSELEMISWLQSCVQWQRVVQVWGPE